MLFSHTCFGSGRFPGLSEKQDASLPRHREESTTCQTSSRDRAILQCLKPRRNAQRLAVEISANPVEFARQEAAGSYGSGEL